MFLGWDIGIKNLSYCILNSEGSIIEWDIIDLTGMDDCKFKCSIEKKNGEVCGKGASFIDKNNTMTFYCKVHSKQYVNVNENTLSEFGGVSRGVCDSFNRQLVSVKETHNIEKKDGEIRSNEKIFHGDELVSMNMWGFGIQVFGYLEERFKHFLNEYGNEEKSEFLIPSVVSDLIKEGVESVDVLNSSEKWFGVTFPEDKKNVSESILKLTSNGVYPEKLF